VIVSVHRKRRPGAQVESGSESSGSERGGRKRKRKYRKLECDEGIRYHKETIVYYSYITVYCSYSYITVEGLRTIVS